MTSHDLPVQDPVPEGGPALDPVVGLVIILALAFLPPVFFAIRLRNAERHRPEPWRAVLSAFAWGATFAVGLALGAGILLGPAFTTLVFGISLGTVLLAPITEEVAKAMGLFLVQDDDPEPEDGFIYGGAAGLGFAATENVVYITWALVVQGGDIWLYTALYRGIVTVALHGAVSAMAGAAIWEARYSGKDGAVFRGLFVAILVHALYNASVSTLPALAALLAGGAAVYVWWRVRKRVRQLDAMGAPVILSGPMIPPR